jgi:DNA-binding GntR family transcriptional regulator
MRNDICDILRDRIVKLNLKPGEQINEKKLAEEFKVSRTPIREALIILSSEDLVTIKPKLGTTVSDINIRDFQELGELRIILEQGVARIAALRATEEQIQALEKLLERIRLADDDNISELLDCDIIFHQIIRQASHNKAADKALSIVQNQFHRIIRSNIHRPKHIMKDLPKVIQALKIRDADQMERLMVNHTERFFHEVAKFPVNSLRPNSGALKG